ncbi:MAG: hypothetical protein ACYC5Y_06800 [Symbiobacteriia bacterium]
MRMVVLESATAVRKDFSRFIDRVTRSGPAFFKRNRDELAALSLEQLEFLLTPYRLTVEYAREENGTFSGGFRELDLVGNAASIKGLKIVLADELVEYAQEYLSNFELYYHAPNRQNHLPYVLRALLQEDSEGVVKWIDG